MNPLSVLDEARLKSGVDLIFLLTNSTGYADMVVPNLNVDEYFVEVDLREHTVAIAVTDDGQLCGGSYTSGADRMTYSQRADDPNVIDGGEAFRDEKNGFRVVRRLP